MTYSMAPLHSLVDGLRMKISVALRHYYLMFRRNLAMHVHLVVWHEHCRNYGGIVVS
jgi:hypothetical protein